MKDDHLYGEINKHRRMMNESYNRKHKSFYPNRFAVVLKGDVFRLVVIESLY
jgi:hypothetical protein